MSRRNTGTLLEALMKRSMVSRRSHAVRHTLVAALIALMAPGCILIRTTEHRIKLGPDGKGEALLRLIDLRSDGVTDSAVTRDFDIMMASFRGEGVKEFERRGRSVTDKKLFASGDTLIAEIAYTFAHPTDIDGLHITDRELFVVIGDGREIVRTNGKIEPWKDGTQRITWPRDVARLLYVVRERQLPPTVSLAALYRARTH